MNEYEGQGGGMTLIFSLYTDMGEGVLTHQAPCIRVEPPAA